MRIPTKDMAREYGDIYVYECPEDHATYWEDFDLEGDYEGPGLVLECEVCGRVCELLGVVSEPEVVQKSIGDFS